MLAMPSDGCMTSQTICAYPLYGEIRCWMVLVLRFYFNLLVQERTTSTENKSHIIVRKT
jgi:hypothetical protein